MKKKIINNPCYGCIYYRKYENESFYRCLVTSFPITEKLLGLCKTAGWKRTRWMHQDTTTQHKHPHYPPAK